MSQSSQWDKETEPRGEYCVNALMGTTGFSTATTTKKWFVFKAYTRVILIVYTFCRPTQQPLVADEWRCGCICNRSASGGKTCEGDFRGIPSHRQRQGWATGRTMIHLNDGTNLSPCHLSLSLSPCLWSSALTENSTWADALVFSLSLCFCTVESEKFDIRNKIFLRAVAKQTDKSQQIKVLKRRDEMMGRRRKTDRRTKKASEAQKTLCTGPLSFLVTHGAQMKTDF